MAVSLDYLPDGGVLFKGSGVMTGEEAIDLNERLVQEIGVGKKGVDNRSNASICNLFPQHLFDLSPQCVKVIRLLQKLNVFIQNSAVSDNVVRIA